MPALLEIDDLHAYYGKSHVLHGVNLQVNQGEVVSLLGRNGAGRSTMLKAIMGQVESQGSIRFKGAQIVGRKAFQIARLGLGYVPETRDIFPTLTVDQNLALGKKSIPHAKPARWTINDMYEMFPLLMERRNVAAGLLSGGEQQMLALCRTLIGDPDLIMVDEPTEGLAPKSVVLIAQYLVALKNKGVAVLLVEQRLAIALEISQRVLVVGCGQIVFEGTPEQLRCDEQVRGQWLGV